MWLIDLWHELSVHPFLRDVIWQSTAATVIGLVAARMFRRDPETAHLALRVGLVAAVIAPVLSIAVRALGLGLIAAPIETAVAPTSLPGGLESVRVESAASLSTWTVLLAAWGIVSIAMFGRVLVSVGRGRRLMAALEWIEDADSTLWLERTARSMGVRRRPRLATRDDVRNPFIWCWGAPVVVLPRAMAERHEDAAVRDVMRHELAHLARQDHWWSLFGTLMIVVLPWHPGVHLSVRRMRDAAETACDRRAVSAGARPDRLASILVNLVAQPEQVLAPGARSSGHRFSQRIRRLLDESGRGWRAGATWRSLVVIGALAVTLGSALMQQRASAASIETPNIVVVLDPTDDAAASEQAPFRTSVAASTLRTGAGLELMPAVLDLGTGAPGATQRGTVWLINRDTDPIELSGIKTSCGCTAAHGFREGVLYPGEAMQIDVTLDAPGTSGESIERTVTVLSEECEPLKFPVRLRTTT